MKFTHTITINRRPAEVFAFLARFENVRLWNHAIRETRKITGGPVGAGSRYRQTRALPTPGSETFEVTAFEPDRRLAIDGTLGPLHGEVTYLLTPAGSSTVLSNTMNLQPSGARRRAVGRSPRQVRRGDESRGSQTNPRSSADLTIAQPLTTRWPFTPAAGAHRAVEAIQTRPPPAASAEIRWAR